MKKMITVFAVIGVFLVPRTGNSFGEVFVLIKILSNAIVQLGQLRGILGTQHDTLSFLREINRGINDSLQLATTIRAGINPGLYGGYTSADQALQEILSIYGGVPASKNEQPQKDMDQSIAEVLTLHQAVHAYTNQVDAVGEQIKAYSHAVSPGGAQKLTAQSLGVVLHVLNESLRTQSTGMKLQAQMMAVENKKEKDWTRHMSDSSLELSQGMKNSNLEFQVPRFSR